MNMSIMAKYICASLTTYARAHVLTIMHSQLYIHAQSLLCNRIMPTIANQKPAATEYMRHTHIDYS